MGLILSASVAAVIAAPAADAAYSSSLTRAPYLSDLTGTSVKVNFGTTTKIVKVRARYGAVGSTGACSPTTVLTGTTRRQGYTMAGSRWLVPNDPILRPRTNRTYREALRWPHGGERPSSHQMTWL